MYFHFSHSSTSYSSNTSFHGCPPVVDIFLAVLSKFSDLPSCLTERYSTLGSPWPSPSSSLHLLLHNSDHHALRLFGWLADHAPDHEEVIVHPPGISTDPLRVLVIPLVVRTTPLICLNQNPCIVCGSKVGVASNQPLSFPVDTSWNTASINFPLRSDHPFERQGYTANTFRPSGQ